MEWIYIFLDDADAFRAFTFMQQIINVSFHIEQFLNSFSEVKCPIIHGPINRTKSTKWKTKNEIQTHLRPSLYPRLYVYKVRMCTHVTCSRYLMRISSEQDTLEWKCGEQKKSIHSKWLKMFARERALNDLHSIHVRFDRIPSIRTTNYSIHFLEFRLYPLTSMCEIYKYIDNTQHSNVAQCRSATQTDRSHHIHHNPSSQRKLNQQHHANICDENCPIEWSSRCTATKQI